MPYLSSLSGDDCVASKLANHDFLGRVVQITMTKCVVEYIFANLGITKQPYGVLVTAVDAGFSFICISADKKRNVSR